MAAADASSAGRRGGRSLPRENPLIPHPVMRRLFNDLIACDGVRAASAPRLRSRILRETAAWTAVFAALETGDSVAAHHGLLPDLLAGRGDAAPAILPVMADAVERALIATGAAASVQMSDGGRGVCVLSLTETEATALLWKKLLPLAAAKALPLLVLLLPDDSAAAADKAGERLLGKTPRLPVDSADVVGIYRAVQESLIRLRHGGGLVVVECQAFPAETNDPLLRMEDYLLVRHFPVARWRRAALVSREL